MHGLKGSRYAPGVNLFRPNPGRRKKISLNFYFHTSFRGLKRFYEGLKGLFISIQVLECIGR